MRSRGQRTITKSQDFVMYSCIDAAVVNRKGIKTLLANGLITFFINGNPVFSNGPNNLPRNPPDCIILDN